MPMVDRQASAARVILSAEQHLARKETYLLYSLNHR